MSSGRYLVDIVESFIEENTRKKDKSVTGNNFVLRYNSAYLTLSAAGLLIAVVIGCMLYLTARESKIHILFFGTGGAAFVCTAVLCSRRVGVNEKGVYSVGFGLFHKDINWSDICTATLKYDSCRKISRTLILKDTNGKALLEVNSAMIGFDHFRRTVKRKIGLASK